MRIGLELVEDEGLLEEVAGLVEWPVVLVGSFDEAFLDIPPEVIRTTIRTNQKCFVLRKPQTALWRTISSSSANIEASDGGKAIVAGNERVIRARLSDARHFWLTDQRGLPDTDTPEMRAAAEQFGLDLSKPLDQRMAKLAAEPCHLPREARHAGRAGGADRAPGQGDRAAGRRRSRARGEERRRRDPGS